MRNTWLATAVAAACLCLLAACGEGIPTVRPNDTATEAATEAPTEAPTEAATEGENPAELPVAVPPPLASPAFTVEEGELEYTCEEFVGDLPISPKAPVQIDDLVAHLPPLLAELPFNRDRAIAYVYGLAQPAGALLTVPLQADCRFVDERFGRILGAFALYGDDGNGIVGLRYAVVAVTEQAEFERATMLVFWLDPESLLVGGVSMPEQQGSFFRILLQPTSTAEGSLPLDSSIRLYEATWNVACFRYLDQQNCFTAAQLSGSALDSLVVAAKAGAQALYDQDIVPEKMQFDFNRTISEIEDWAVLEECKIVGECTTDMLAAPVVDPDEARAVMLAYGFDVGDRIPLGVLVVARPTLDLNPGAYLLMATDSDGAIVPPGHAMGVEIDGFDLTGETRSTVGKRTDRELLAVLPPYLASLNRLENVEVTSFCLLVCFWPQTAGGRID